ENLQEILDDANTGESASIHRRELKKNVDIAKVWLEKTKNGVQFDPLPCFFIKNDDGLYVGIVYDMIYDLHWYISPNFRKRGLLTKSMREIILPYLSQTREKQSISIDSSQLIDLNYEASLKVAQNLGFQFESGKSYVLDLEKYSLEEWIEGENNDLSQERIEFFKNQLETISYSLWKIQTEVEMNLGESVFTEEVLQLVEEIKSKRDILQDEYWDFKGINLLK
ncbi:MAG TPA: hypothetical protein DEF78_17465, partial [Sphingobacterium sp.]|nr:hypothetical protein [Sphingobacterium sp.]